MMVPPGHLSFKYLWKEATKLRSDVGHILKKRAGDSYWISLAQSADDLLWTSLCRLAGNSLTASNMGQDQVRLDMHVCLQAGFTLSFLLDNGIDPSFCEPYQMWNLRKHPSVTPDWRDECRSNPQSLCRGPLVNPNRVIDPTEAVWSEPGFATPPVLISIQDGCIDTRFIFDALKLNPKPLFSNVGHQINLDELHRFNRWKLSMPEERFDNEWPTFVDSIRRQAKDAVPIERSAAPGRPNRVDIWADLYFSTFPDGHAPLHWSEVCSRLESIAGRALDVAQNTLSGEINRRKKLVSR